MKAHEETRPGEATHSSAHDAAHAVSSGGPTDPAASAGPAPDDGAAAGEARQTAPAADPAAPGAPEAGGDAGGSPGGGGGGDTSGADGSGAAAEIARLTQERDELEDRYVRLMAEFDNFRRRTRREADDVRARAAGDVVAGLLPVVDNLERALGAAGSATGPAKAFMDGVDMILKQFLYELERLGVSPIPTDGRPFDPNLHEAVAYEASASVPEGHIIEALQKGYIMGERVLRPSVVKVAKGASEQGGSTSV